MGRTTEMHKIAMAIVTRVTLNVGEETNIPVISLSFIKKSWQTQP